MPVPVISPAEALRIARIERHLTQKELGVKLGYEDEAAQPIVSAWESGSRDIPLTMIRLICDVLGLRCDCMLVPRGGMPSVHHPQRPSEGTRTRVRKRPVVRKPPSDPVPPEFRKQGKELKKGERSRPGTE